MLASAIWYVYFCFATLRSESRKRSASLSFRLRTVSSSSYIVGFIVYAYSSIDRSGKAATSCRYALKTSCSLPEKYVCTCPGRSAFSETYVLREYSFKGSTSSHATPTTISSAHRYGGILRIRASLRSAKSEAAQLLAFFKEQTRLNSQISAIFARFVEVLTKQSSCSDPSARRIVTSFVATKTILNLAFGRRVYPSRPPCSLVLLLFLSHFHAAECPPFRSSVPRGYARTSFGCR